MDKFNISVLLVEDDRLSLVIYSEFIRKIVNDVYTASDGHEGIAVYREHKPDIVITDIMMPGIDGLEMIREIKKIDPTVKVIMISGHSEVDYFIRSIDLGVEGYLLKPIDNVKLKNKISELGDNILLSKKVAETEKKFQDFAALLPQIVFEADMEGRLTFVNELALKIFDYTKADLDEGLYLKNLVRNEAGKAFPGIMKTLSEGNNFQELEVRCRTKKGKYFPALIYTSGIADNDVLSGIRGVMVDITSRKKMMEELKTLNLELEEKVKERTARLVDEIKEKEKAEKALIKAKEKAEESDKLKGIFLANVSHEIQTPIKAIMSFSNLLHTPGQDEVRRSELIGIIESNGKALLNLTNDILEFTRLQSNTVKFYKINFDLNLFLEELYPVFETLKRKSSGKEVNLKLSLPQKGRPVLINSDPSRLRQIYTNLISNAFKFTHEGYVEYGYENISHGGIRFYVKDTGLGISKQYQKKIFERFIQEPKPLSIKKEGTGLGLPITQSLIEILGGKIWVDSTPGKGSTFFFELPGLAGGQEKDKDTPKYNWDDKQVLIIEDDIQDYIAIETMLKSHVKLHFLNNPEQALEYCSKNQDIDLCLIGWPVGKTKQASESLTKMRTFHPLIAMLPKTMKTGERASLRKEFADIITKPLQQEELLATLDKYLS